MRVAERLLGVLLGQLQLLSPPCSGGGWRELRRCTVGEVRQLCIYRKKVI